MSAPRDIARIAVCEDSRTFAAGLRGFLERDDDLRVVCVCQSAEQLLAALPGARPDLVTMDLDLPGMDGVEATRRIMATTPVPVLVLSEHSGRGSERAAAALSAGALDAVPKSELRLDAADGLGAVALRRRVKRLARARVPGVRRNGAGAAGSAAGAVLELNGRRIGAIGVCSSTGGPQALRTMLDRLPADFAVPVLVVQHIAPTFVDGLVRWLDRDLAVPVRIARDGEPLESGVTFAADGAHLVVHGGRLGFDERTAVGPHRPSGDVLLRSLASELGAEAAAVVLTGMGRDGADGLAAVAAAGGETFAQDEASAAVFGMPRAAAERGAAHVLDPPTIGSTLATLHKVGVRA
jgi:two-component system chemotaxis response regulator CheB